jgi:hypothetical protein
MVSNPTPAQIRPTLPAILFEPSMYPVYFTIGLILTVAIIGFISEQIKKSKAKKNLHKRV